MKQYPYSDKYCVYEHLFPNGKRYIGITHMKPERRWGKNGSNYKQQFMANAIKKYGWDNIKHNIIVENLTKDEACEKEKELIKLYDTTNHIKGYNLSTGGETNSKIKTPEHIEHVKQGRKHCWKKVCQYSLTGELIDTYESSQLAENSTGVSKSKIIACCKSKRKMASGFQWRYATDNINQLPPYKKVARDHKKDKIYSKKVFRYKNGGYEKESTLGEEARILKTTIARITQSIKKGYSHKGYRFYYEKRK